MNKILIGSFLLFPVLFCSCLSSKVTEVEFKTNNNCTKKYGAYQHSSYFPFTCKRSFYKRTTGEPEFSAFLVLADRSIMISLRNVQPYLLKNGDTILLKEKEPGGIYSYPGIVNEPELSIHFDYSVTSKTNGSIKQIGEDIKLYRCGKSFRSVH